MAIYKRGDRLLVRVRIRRQAISEEYGLYVGKGTAGEKSPKELARDVETAKRHALALAP
jgi:hypothetical protein